VISKKQTNHFETGPGGIRGEERKSMNKTRRNQLKEAIKLLEHAMSVISAMADEEQEAFDNMPESLQDGERGEQMQDYISSLEDMSFSIEELMTDLEEITEG